MRGCMRCGSKTGAGRGVVTNCLNCESELKKRKKENDSENSTDVNQGEQRGKNEKNRKRRF